MIYECARVLKVILTPTQYEEVVVFVENGTNPPSPDHVLCLDVEMFNDETIAESGDDNNTPILLKIQNMIKETCSSYVIIDSARNEYNDEE